MKVYRLENPKTEMGPFRDDSHGIDYHNFPGVEFRDTKEMLMSKFKVSPKIAWDSAHYFISGCLKIEELKIHFGEYLNTLSLHGFKIAVLEIKEENLIEDYLQVFFFKEDVISKEYIQ